MPNRMVDALLFPCVLLCHWLENMGIGFERAAGIAAVVYIVGLAILAALIVCVGFGAPLIFWRGIAALTLIALAGYFVHLLIEYLRAF